MSTKTNNNVLSQGLSSLWKRVTGEAEVENLAKPKRVSETARDMMGQPKTLDRFELVASVSKDPCHRVNRPPAHLDPQYLDVCNQILKKS